MEKDRNTYDTENTKFLSGNSIFGETEKYLMNWKKKQLFYKQKLGDRWRASPEFGDLVFTSTLGSPVTRYVLSSAIDRLVNNINMKELTIASREGREIIPFEDVYPHAFRHTFATRCFEKGMSPLVIQRIMGHANYATTLSYTHLLNDKKKEEINRIGDFLA